MSTDLGLEYSVRNLLNAGEAFTITALTLILNGLHDNLRSHQITRTQVQGALDKLKSRGLASSGLGLAHFPVRKNGKVELVTKKATLFFSTELK